MDSMAASLLEGKGPASVGGTGGALGELGGGGACITEASCGRSTGVGQHGDPGGNLAVTKSTLDSPHTLGEPASPGYTPAHVTKASDDATQLEEEQPLFSSPPRSPLASLAV